MINLQSAANRSLSAHHGRRLLAGRQGGAGELFHLFFRRLPFKGGYAIAAGLELALEWLEAFRFGTAELDYLASLRTKVGTPLFQEGFLKYLGDLRLKLGVDAVPEGAAVFAHEPMLRIQGPILHAQLAETALLNILNFQTLIATKAARVCQAAAGSPVVEFGYRRAQGPNGGCSASRAAWIGGCEGTSNVLAGQRFGIPVLGTHAHSWVMSFDDEAEAFDRYAEAMPDNSTLLVDTYDTLHGVDHAIATAHKLRARGHELNGIRLDSGDLAWLSQQARAKLDAAGFPDVKVVASNDLDEHLIESLRHQGARIDIWASARTSSRRRTSRRSAELQAGGPAQGRRHLAAAHQAQRTDGQELDPRTPASAALRAGRPVHRGRDLRYRS